MAASKSLLALGFLAATLALFLLSFQIAAARELADTTEHKTVKEAVDAGAKDQKHPDQYGGYPGGGYGGYPGRGGGYGGYPGRGGGYGGNPGHGGGYGGYPGHGGGYGGYPGHGGGNYCRWGCCRRGYHGCQCCSFKGEVPDAEFQAKPGN